VFGNAASGVAADWSPPVDADARLTYEASTSTAVLTARAELEGATVGEVVAGIELPYAALRAPGDAPLPWRGGVTATLNELPLGAFPLLADRGLKGSVSGRAAVSGLNESPAAEVDLEIPKVTLGDTSFGGRIRAEIAPASAEDLATTPIDVGAVDAGAIDAAPTAPEPRGAGDPIGLATLEVDLRDGKNGSVALLGHARVGWKDRLVPIIDGERRGGVALSAERFQIAAAQPIVSDAVSKLRGLLDGQAVFEWGDDAGTGRIASASLRVREGVVYVPQLGQELKGVTAQLDAEGPGEFVLSDVVAEGVAGRASGAARVHLDGLQLSEAAAVLHIAEGEEMPLTFAGVPTGRVRTEIEIQVKNDVAARRLDAHVDVKSLHFEMPSFSSRSVQSLDDHPGVAIDVPLGPTEEEKRDDDGSSIVLHIAMKEVVVKAAELATIEVATPKTLQGGRAAEPLIVRLAGDVQTSGDIAVTRGTFDFLGKEFELDSGLVRLREEDPGNPFVNVTAHWDGPDGGRIIIDYVGVLQPITDDKIKFRSDPARSEREILASLLFGESLSDIPAGGSSGAGGTGQGNVAGSVGGSVASSGLNEILRNTALRRFSANIGTTDTGNLRTGVEFQASDDLRLGLAQENQQAQATGGEGQATTSATAADRTRTELSVAWRFHRTWSLRSTFGRAGTQPLTGVDLIWQYRY
jgi:translocation and assembly module TamB